MAKAALSLLLVALRSSSKVPFRMSHKCSSFLVPSLLSLSIPVTNTSLANSFFSATNNTISNNEISNLESNNTTLKFSNSSSHNDAILDVAKEDSEEVKINKLLQSYGNKLIRTSIPELEYCDIYLCGTIHVGSSSSLMVEHVISVVKPDFVLLELCAARSDSLVSEEVEVVSLREVFADAWHQRSLQSLCMNLLSWLQSRAASLAGGRGRLGGEQSAAFRAARTHGAKGAVLGDRDYLVTISRAFDRLSFFQRVRLAMLMLWESLSLSSSRMQTYMSEQEQDAQFVDKEILLFRKHMPEFAEVIIDERDTYLAQSIVELAKYCKDYGTVESHSSVNGGTRKRVVAVVGAGHLLGIDGQLRLGGVSDERMKEISSSSQHQSTWEKNKLVMHFFNHS